MSLQIKVGEGAEVRAFLFPNVNQESLLLVQPHITITAPSKGIFTSQTHREKENNICNRCGVKQHNYKCTSFIYSNSGGCYTHCSDILAEVVTPSSPVMSCSLSVLCFCPS